MCVRATWSQSLPSLLARSRLDKEQGNPIRLANGMARAYGESGSHPSLRDFLFLFLFPAILLRYRIEDRRIMPGTCHPEPLCL